MENNTLTPKQEMTKEDILFQQLIDGYLASNHRKKVDIDRKSVV